MEHRTQGGSDSCPPRLDWVPSRTSYLLGFPEGDPSALGASDGESKGQGVGVLSHLYRTKTHINDPKLQTI